MNISGKSVPAWLKLALLIAFIAINLPMLRWSDFTTAEEDVVVATAMELHHDGHWKIPTMSGVPRVIKPPLLAWETAAVISPGTLQALDGPARDQAYRAFNFQARLPATASAAIMLIGVYFWGKSIGGENLGLVSAAICATNFLFLRHAQMNAYDIELAAWCTVASALLSYAILQNRRALYIAAGAALGIAWMYKGPVCLLLSAVPAGIYLFLCRERAPIKAVIIGTIVMLALGGWWFVWVGFSTPGAWVSWYHQVFRQHENAFAPSPWYRYFVSFYFFFPWVIFIVIGLIDAAIAVSKRRDDPICFPLIAFALPFLIMCLINERHERYLVPLVAPLAIIAARAALGIIAQKINWALAAQWILTVFFALALPIAGTTTKFKSLVTVDQTAWWPPATGAGLALLLIAVVAGCFAIRRKFPAAILAAGMIIFMTHHVLYSWGNSLSEGGQSEMRPVAEKLRALAPANVEYASFHPSGNYVAVFSNSAELEIYLNRTIYWVEDVNSVPPRTRIWFTDHGKKTPAPKAPPRSREILVEQRSKEVQRFYLEGPAPSGPSRELSRKKDE